MINETTACSGWTCAQCGIWVPSGQTHFCGSSNTHQPLLSVPCYACGLNAKIDMLLEKLTKLIDVLPPKLKTSAKCPDCGGELAFFKYGMYKASGYPDWYRCKSCKHFTLQQSVIENCENEKQKGT